MIATDEFNLADYYLFDRVREGLGSKPAILFGQRHLTYGEIASNARDFAAALRAWGVAREQRVYLVLPDQPSFATAFFGTLAHGAVVAMGNPHAPPPDLAHALDYTRADVLVTVPRVAEALSDAIGESRWLRTVVLVHEVPTGGDEDAPLALPDLAGRRVVPMAQALEAGRREASAALPPTKRDDVAIWLFTSGSTGRAKAAVHTHRDFAFNTEAYAKRTVGYRSDDITVSVPRLFFGYATGTNLMFPFAVGATVGLFSEKPTPESLADAIRRYLPTIVTNVPTMMGKLLEFDESDRAAGGDGLDLSSVRFHLSAGEALPPALLSRFQERFGAEVYDGIGSAEMFHIYASNRPGDVRPGSLGRAVDGYTLRVLPEDAEGPGAGAVAPGEIGVLWVKGDSVALGYFQDREKSWRTFHGHWCRTGDLFRMDAEGYLWFGGRSDDLLKVSGQWVAPIEVEDTLLGHSAVAAAAVIGATEAGLVRVKAFVVLRDAARGDDPEALRAGLAAHVRSRLAGYKCPRWFVFVEDLPRNDRGKIDRKALAEREARGENPWA